MSNDNNRLKYYYYVSESKVEMLYSQIPKSTISQLESELKINLPIVGVSFSKKQVDDSLYTRLQIVVEYIQRNMEIGSVQSPKEYFRGSAFMRWAQIHLGVVFFGGKINKTNVGLGGSTKNLLGQRTTNVEIGISHTPWLAALLLKEIENQITLIPWQPEIANPHLTEENQNERVLSAASFWAGNMAKDPVAKFEFLAKKLVYADHMGEKVLLGTPIYVELIDAN
jgi:hypothetical protein